MALKCVKGLKNGGSAEYWKLANNVKYDITRRCVSATLYLYVNESARRANKSYVSNAEVEDPVNSITSFSLTGDEAVEALQTGDPRPAMYAKLKTMPFFSGSQDV